MFSEVELFCERIKAGDFETRTSYFFSRDSFEQIFFSGHTKFTFHIAAAAAAGFKAMIDANDKTDANDVTVTEATDQNQLRWKSNFFSKKLPQCHSIIAPAAERRRL